MQELDILRTRCQAAGLAWRGAFHPGPEDAVPFFADGHAVGTLVLLGFAGRQQWEVFTKSPEYADGHPDPLDRWSRRIIDSLAPSDGAAFYPFGGPPWLPFQRWAARAEPVHVSPLRILIHPDWGLWHSYRGAIALLPRLPLPVPPAQTSPCEACIDKPCLRGCPVQAVSLTGFDGSACLEHIATKSGAACREGCLARRSCPVASSHRYGADQARFHLKALLTRAGVAE
jgi:hypothetical protein